MGSGDIRIALITCSLDTHDMREFTCLEIAHGVDAVHCTVRCGEVSTADVRVCRSRSDNWILTYITVPTVFNAHTFSVQENNDLTFTLHWLMESQIAHCVNAMDGHGHGHADTHARTHTHTHTTI